MSRPPVHSLLFKEWLVIIDRDVGHSRRDRPLYGDLEVTRRGTSIKMNGTYNLQYLKPPRQLDTAIYCALNAPFT
jgi:hypothetical protein